MNKLSPTREELKVLESVRVNYEDQMDMVAEMFNRFFEAYGEQLDNHPAGDTGMIGRLQGCREETRRWRDIFRNPSKMVKEFEQNQQQSADSIEGAY